MQHDPRHDDISHLRNGPVSFRRATGWIFLFDQEGFSARLSIRSDGSTELTVNGDSVLVAKSPQAAKCHAETLYAAHLADGKASSFEVRDCLMELGEISTLDPASGLFTK